jgi:BarA-like signal transduction histidine kinase
MYSRLQISAPDTEKLESKHLRFLESHTIALVFNILANTNLQTEWKDIRFLTARTQQKLRF